MNQPRISIIIPVYNVEPYIAECLQSVMRQNYVGPIECIVVDDCGTDRSMAVVERLIAEYDGPIDFVVLHHEKNKGLSCARNTGMDVAHGDYIFFLDSDDWISDDCIGHLVSLTIDKSFEMISGGMDVFRGEYEEKGKGNDALVVKKISGQEFLFNWVRDYSSVISVWNKLYPKKYLQKKSARFKSIPLAEDVLFNYELFCKPSTIYVSNRVTYHYRKREGSVIDVVRKNPLKDRDEIVLLWLELKKVRDDNGFDFFNEYYLHCYGYRIFALSKRCGLRFYHVFRLLHKEYPYRPLKIWMTQKESFSWYLDRLMWSLPSLMGFVWFQETWRIKRLIKKD